MENTGLKHNRLKNRNKDCQTYFGKHEHVEAAYKKTPVLRIRSYDFLKPILKRIVNQSTDDLFTVAFHCNKLVTNVPDLILTDAGKDLSFDFELYKTIFSKGMDAIVLYKCTKKLPA